MINKDLKIAIQAALEGGVEIMKVYQNEIEVEYKDDNSPLTIADQKCNDIINSYLINTEYPIISEENKQNSFEERKEWESCWIVDPLDGTKEFIKRNGEFTVNIALIKNGQPQLGVIYVPVTKVLYYADVIEKRAFKCVLDKQDLKDFDFEIIEKKAIVMLPNRNKTNKIRVVGSRSHMSLETEEFVSNLKNNYKDVEIVSKGSSLKFCIVAEGNADIYPRFAPTMEWDTAAGQAICEAVGLKVISKETSLPLLYNKENLLNPWFVVN